MNLYIYIYIVCVCVCVCVCVHDSLLAKCSCMCMNVFMPYCSVFVGLSLASRLVKPLCMWMPTCSSLTSLVQTSIVC